MMTRDRSIDAVRAVAVAGVVSGHWLVTGLVVDDAGAWRQASPLSAMPGFVPVSWLLQTLGLFFFAGGFAAARDPRHDRAGRVRGVVPERLIRPLAVLLGFWAVVLGIGAAIGTPAGTLRTIAVLVVSPLWFLLPYLVLRAVTPALLRPHPAVVLAPAVLVVAASDAGQLPSWAAIGAAWSVPWVLFAGLTAPAR
jgi:hypothetical protein